MRKNNSASGTKTDATAVLFEDLSKISFGIKTRAQG
jgi:hypothetical protein